MGRWYKDPVAWQKSMELVTAVYRVTAKFPKEELFGILLNYVVRPYQFPATSQRGLGRLSEKEFRHFLGQARGSLMELETQLQMAENLGYLEKKATDDVRRDRTHP